ncbi:MAG: bis(5'-nucleosyl)-tetraphosphatase (symmetrical) YqeK [Lachnospiraceae bacterium]
MHNFSTEDEYLKSIEKKLSKELDKKRYVHTLGVAYTAVSLAMAHGDDLYDAYLAGLLHDNAKCIPTNEKRRLCKKYDIRLNDAEEKNPDLLHAKLGAVLAKEKYDVTDNFVLNAIRYHTTGKPGMTELEKIIYIADYIEPNRKMLPDLPKVRMTAFRNLNEAMVLILQGTLQYLKEKNASIDQLTQETYEYYKNLTDM